MAFIGLLVWIGKRSEPQTVKQPVVQSEPEVQRPTESAAVIKRPKTGRDAVLAERWQAWYARCKPEQVQGGEWHFAQADCVETRPR
jgi:hypothetical protein